MTDYTKLVAALRCRATRDWTNCGNCKYADEDDDPRGCWGTKICADAADAIEALQAQLPKRGEWVYNDGDYIPYCSICGMPQDTETPYCHFCGAKMEVQE